MLVSEHLHALSPGQKGAFEPTLAIIRQGFSQGKEPVLALLERQALKLLCHAEGFFDDSHLAACLVHGRKLCHWIKACPKYCSPEIQILWWAITCT